MLPEQRSVTPTTKEVQLVKTVIIDGQGGKIGRLLVEQLKKTLPELKLTVIGTNSIATAAMLKAGADQGATGENPVVVSCRDADLIIGPLGIIIANSLLGEVTPAMAVAIGQSRAKKILIPVARCGCVVLGAQELSFNDYISLAISEIRQALSDKS